MKLRQVLTPAIVWPLLLLATWGGGSPVVLCVGAREHVALESPSAACCSGPQACGPRSPAVHGHDPGEGADCGACPAPDPAEGGCVDVPVTLWRALTHAQGLQVPTGAVGCPFASPRPPASSSPASQRPGPGNPCPPPPQHRQTVLLI